MLDASNRYTALWMVFILLLLGEHLYLGFRAHQLVLENQVLAARLDMAITAEISLSNFVKELMPTPVEDQDRSGKKRVNPPSPGIKLDTK